MFLSWSAVSVAFAGVVDDFASLSDFEQPDRSAAAARTAASANLFAMVFLGEFVAMPPAAAQRLKQRGGVGVSVRLRQHQGRARLLIGLLGVQQGEIARIAVLELPLRQIERDFGGVSGVRSRLQSFGILL